MGLRPAVGAVPQHPAHAHATLMLPVPPAVMRWNGKSTGTVSFADVPMQVVAESVDAVSLDTRDTTAPERASVMIDRAVIPRASTTLLWPVAKTRTRFPYVFPSGVPGG